MILYGGGIEGILFMILLFACCVVCCLGSCGCLDGTPVDPDTSFGGMFKKIKISNYLGDVASPLKSLKFW